MLLLKRLRKLVIMAKRNKLKAKQSRSGKSPYAKYKKAPYQYPTDYVYNELINGVLCRKGVKVMRKEEKERYLEAAE